MNNDTTTAIDLAAQLANELNIDEDTLRTAVEAYAEQLETHDDRDIDTCEINADDAAFLLETVRQAAANGEIR